MPQAGTVHIRGWNEISRSLNKIERGAHKTVLGGVMKAAEPVRRDWVTRMGRYRGASVSTIQPRMTTKAVFIRQNARKVTGRRGDFGSLTMRHGLSSLAENADETRAAVEKALDDLVDGEGF